MGDSAGLLGCASRDTASHHWCGTNKPTMPTAGFAVSAAAGAADLQPAGPGHALASCHRTSWAHVLACCRVLQDIQADVPVSVKVTMKFM
jgi:hypothetical protein